MYIRFCTYMSSENCGHSPVRFKTHGRNAMDKPNKAAELNAGIRSSIQQLANETDAARQSELFRNYLRASAAFWDYSWCNQMLIWRQRPDASYVGGFNTWLKCGRYVRRGEKGIAILAPCSSKIRMLLGKSRSASGLRPYTCSTSPRRTAHPYQNCRRSPAANVVRTC